MIKQNYLRLGCEAIFVLKAIIILKSWIFPFFISIWFPIDDLSSQMIHWTVLMVGVVTCFLYLGLGSLSKFGYHFTSRDALFFFTFFHLPFFLPISFMKEAKETWLSLFGDFLSLFFAQVPFSVSQNGIFFFYLLLFFLGRKVQVMEEESEIVEKKVRQTFRTSSYES
jgi:hypothetical protein